MVLAIVRKELRETRAFAALALGLYLIYVSNLTGTGAPCSPRCSDGCPEWTWNHPMFRSSRIAS